MYYSCYSHYFGTMTFEINILLVISAIIWFFIILRWDVYSDYKKWKVGTPIDHFKEAVIRGVYLLPSHIFLFTVKTHTGNNFWDFLLYITIVSGLLFSIWWEFFDGWYNKLRGFRWRFNGSVDKDDAMLDKLLYKLGDKAEGLLKWGLIVTFFFLYIKVK